MSTPPSQSDETLAILPPDIDDNDWAKIKLKSLRLSNFIKHKDIFIEFMPKKISMNCIVGKNGTGKTTILNAVQLLFANFNAYEIERLKTLMLKNVRNHMSLTADELDSADFLVEGIFEVNDGSEYSVVIKRDGFHSKHPNNILENLQYYCYSASFDKELHLFQLKRDRWPKFKELMEAVTGYEIEEDVQTFQLDSDPKFRRIMRDYVIAFKMDKGREVIGHRQCSAGERKIIRTFSALLNRPITPSIILIDNVTDHIEASRHISVINALEKTFSNSQIIVTCHSTPVQRYLPDSNQLLDMRLLNWPNEKTRQQWRLKVIDELEDLQLRLSTYDSKTASDDLSKSILTTRGDSLLYMARDENYSPKEVFSELKTFAKDVFEKTLQAGNMEELIRIHGG